MSKEEEERIYDLEDRLIAFAVRVIQLAESPPRTKAGSNISGQLIRCGTSPASNYGEAQSAESRHDFIQKLKVSLKELRETRIWLLLVERTKLLKSSSNLEALIAETNELISIFVKSIKTAKQRK